MVDSASSLVHVAVAVILNDQHQVLLARRPDHVHQGGLWEFPGGKLEAGESVEQALKREIAEELGILIVNSSPLIRLRHDYPDKSVLLDVWQVDEYSGTPRGLEGQPLLWKPVENLSFDDFPQANRAIIRALQLPDVCLITGSFSNEQDFKRRLEAALEKGVRLVQLRTKVSMSVEEYLHLAALAEVICRKYSACLLLNTSVEIFNQTAADGLHLNSQRLDEYQERPVSDQVLLSASCHNTRQLTQARKLGVDLVLISPVKQTSSHPGVPGIGWAVFSQLVDEINVPAYALGGMNEEDLEMAKSSGAQGIAAISSYWCDER